MLLIRIVDECKNWMNRVGGFQIPGVEIPVRPNGHPLVRGTSGLGVGLWVDPIVEGIRDGTNRMVEGCVVGPRSACFSASDIGVLRRGRVIRATWRLGGLAAPRGGYWSAKVADFTL